MGPGSQDQLHQHPHSGGHPGEGAEDVPQTGGGPHQCQGLDDGHEGGLGVGREALLLWLKYPGPTGTVTAGKHHCQFTPTAIKAGK